MDDTSFSVDPFPRLPLQFLNEFQALHALERRESIAHHRPVEVHLQLSSVCNLDCIMCCAHNSPRPDTRDEQLFLPPTLFDRICQEILRYSSTVEFGVGGEAMMSPHFHDYLEHAYFLKQRVSLLTNGTLINTDFTARLLARCLSSIHISMDGATARTYESIRRGGKFDRLLRNIERLNRFRFEDPPGRRLRMTLGMVLMRNNIEELPRLVERAASLRAERIVAWHVIPVTKEGADNSLAREPELANRCIADAREAALSRGIEADLPRPYGPAIVDPCDIPTYRRSPTHCRLPSVAVFIFHDGRVYPCGHPYAHMSDPLGNLAHQSFEEIWNGRPFRNLRAGLAHRDMPPVCATCSMSSDSPDGLEVPDGPAPEPPGLVRYFGDRDLAPVPGGMPTIRVLDEAGEIGLALALQRRMREHGEMNTVIQRTEFETRGMTAHIANLESERSHLTHHVANLEKERTHLTHHVANLEKALENVHSERLYRTLARFRRLYRGFVPKPGGE